MSMINFASQVNGEFKKQEPITKISDNHLINFITMNQQPETDNQSKTLKRSDSQTRIPNPSTSYYFTITLFTCPSEVFKR